MLNPEFKKKWVEALRSGEYKQGQGALHRADEDTYCCLGVACKISNVLLSYTSLRDKLQFKEDLIDRCTNLNDNRYDISGINQGAKSFEYIADYIEENY